MVRRPLELSCPMRVQAKPSAVARSAQRPRGHVGLNPPGLRGLLRAPGLLRSSGGSMLTTWLARAGQGLMSHAQPRRRCADTPRRECRRAQESTGAGGWARGAAAQWLIARWLWGALMQNKQRSTGQGVAPEEGELLFTDCWRPPPLQWGRAGKPARFKLLRQVHRTPPPKVPNSAA